MNTRYPREKPTHPTVIDISHNPFTSKTEIWINGCYLPEEWREFYYGNKRFQSWITTLFSDLTKPTRGDKNYIVRFKGLSSDYHDVSQAANVARPHDINIEVEWKKARCNQTRIKELRQLISWAKSMPEMRSYYNKNHETIESIKNILDRNFEIHVVATMSSGKSTLINAMLGRDLLPAANEATTATITRITDNKSMAGRFSAQRINKAGHVVDSDENVNLDTLKQWNQWPDTQRINIECNILAMQQREDVRLVLTDTPGPNNSQNDEHERTTMGFIQDSQHNPLILYVLNATQLGTHDDRNLLRLVAKTMHKGGKQSKDRFIFVINKMDALDPENGEHLPSVLARVRQYLVDNGIENPMLYPVSANLTRLIRKPNDQHTAKERGDFYGMSYLFSEEASMNLLQYMPLSQRVQRQLENKGYSDLLLSSGLPAVETLIDEYIDKYNLPHRLKRAYDAMNTVIDAGLNQARLLEQLDQNERALQHINDEIELLQQHREKGFDAVAYKNKLEREGKVLPESTEQAMVLQETDVKFFFKGLDKEFIDKKVAQDKAYCILQETEERIRFEFNKTINELEKIFNASQSEITQELNKEHQIYIKSIFQDCKNLNLPILEGIRQSVSDISLNLEVQQHEIRTQKVVTETRSVSDSTWYKPWTWGDKKRVNTYKNEDYVNLEEIWKTREIQIRDEFTSLLIIAKNRIHDGKDVLIDQYLTFMNREFDQKFNEILKKLQEKLSDQKARESAIAEARTSLDWIKNFKSRLDATLLV